MLLGCLAPEADRILGAKLSGTAQRHARWRALTPAEEAEAVAELAQTAAGRTDLLAQEAGLALGYNENRQDEARHNQAAELLIKAGADQELIPQWIEEGRRRARNPR
jgi:hypothetical protein